MNSFDGFLHIAQVNLAPAPAGGVPAAAPAGDAPAPAGAPAAVSATTTAPGTAPAPGPAPQEQQGGGMMFFVWIGVMVLVFWLLIFRPQQKRSKQQKQFLSELKRGDNVLTNAGMYGKVVSLDDNVATLEVSQGVRVRVLKSTLAGRANAPEEGGAEKDKSLVEKG